MMQISAPSTPLDISPASSPNEQHPTSSSTGHQHRCKDKLKAQRHQLLCDKVNSWLSPKASQTLNVSHLSDPSATAADSGKETCALLKRFLQIIKDIVHLEGYHYKRNLMIPTLLYADKYVQKCGLLSDLR